MTTGLLLACVLRPDPASAQPPPAQVPPPATAESQAAQGQEADTRQPRDFTDPLRVVQRIRLAGGETGRQVEVVVHRWRGVAPVGESAEAGRQAFVIEIAGQPPFLENVSFVEGARLDFGPDEAQKTVTLQFDVTSDAPVTEADLVLLVKADRAGFTPDERRLTIPLDYEAAPMRPDPSVGVCVLRDDAPETVDVENAVDYCDPERQPLEYDRIAVFFTPSRDVREPVEDREPFLWRIVGPHGDTLGQGASGSFGPRLPDDTTPFAREGSPGRFAAVIDLWDRDDRPDPAESRRGPGTYTMQSAAGTYDSPGVFGQGELQVTRKVLSGLGEELRLAEWEDEGTFEVASSRLYFQGFVAEQITDVALPAGADLWEGQLTIDQPSVTGTTVSVEGRAWWRSASTRQGQRVPGDAIERAGSRLTLEFPEQLAPGHKEMGTIAVRLTPVERGDLFFTGGMHLMIPTTTRPPDRPLVSGPAPVVWAAYGNLTGPGTGGDPFQRFEFEAPDPLAYGEFWVWPRGPSGQWAGQEAVELDGKLTLRSGKADQAAGEPERRLPAHLHDPNTIWVIPVFLTLTDEATVRSPDRTLAMRSYGYAVYAARRGTYTEPLPEGGPEAGVAPAPGEEPPADPDDPSDPSDPRDPANPANPVDPVNPSNPGDPADPPDPRDPDVPGRDSRTDPGTGAVDPGALDPERPDIAPLIREWLAVAEPPENADGASFRYDDWGRRIGSAAPGMGRTVGAAPPPDGGGSPVAFAWRQRAGLDSIDHCLLEEYVVARLAEASIAACAGRYARTVATPDLSGLTLDEAIARLGGQGLEIEPVLLGPAPSPDRARRVERQDPVATGRARPGSTVTVWVYGDHQPAMATVPDLAGQSLADAQRIASEAGLVLAPSLVGAAPTPDLARRIAAQRPGARAEVAPGATVEVDVYGDYVAPGVTVPRLVGLTLDEAQAALEPLGLAIAPSLVGGAPTEAQAFRVDAQEPAPDTPVAPGATVRIDVWGAYAPPSPPPPPQQREVPDVTGGGTGGARWVLVETQVNPRNEPTEFVVGVTPNYYSARFQGSYERWTVTDTGIGISRRWMDRQNLEMDVTVQVSFPRPPAELAPGQTIALQATFSHQGTVNVGNPGIAFQYSVGGARLTGENAMTYAPYAPTFSGRSAISSSFVVPPITTGELRVEASLWNCGACHVIWVYRARQ